MRPVRTFKNIRVLGIAESFKKDSELCVLSGIVMRRDFLIDGFSFELCTVGGMDSAQKIENLYKKMNREDINVILINGCIISWFNVVDIDYLYEKIGIPLACISYEHSNGLEKYIRKFEDFENRMKIYKKIGERNKVKIKTGKEVYVRYRGFRNLVEVKAVLDAFTISGAVPEPLKVAKLLSNSLLKFLQDLTKK